MRGWVAFTDDRNDKMTEIFYLAPIYTRDTYQDTFKIFLYFVESISFVIGNPSSPVTTCAGRQ
jgi:hypothetical protein